MIAVGVGLGGLWIGPFVWLTAAALLDSLTRIDDVGVGFGAAVVTSAIACAVGAWIGEGYGWGNALREIRNRLPERTWEKLRREDPDLDA